MAEGSVILGDCFDILAAMGQREADLIYLDPPFFTQKEHKLSTRFTEKTFSFSDTWSSNYEFALYMQKRIKLMHFHLKETGALFVHCDTNSNYIFRIILNNIFGKENFRSEIIWVYKRWSNTSKKLLPNHQYILYYTKSHNYTFHKTYLDYAPTTNLDQNLQKRNRDNRNKSVYTKDKDGNIILENAKKGVPLSDVWHIPLLNPKAVERVGYPTQKPVLLMEDILKIFSNEGDLIVDPFCGSGSMLVAAKLMNREYFGIDSSEEAVSIAQKRLDEPKKTTSFLTKRDYTFYNNIKDVIRHKLVGVDCNFIRRNKGIDAILKTQIKSKNVFIRLQRHNESVQSAVDAIEKAVASKGGSINIVILSDINNGEFVKPRTKELTYLIEDIPTMISKITSSLE